MNTRPRSAASRGLTYTGEQPQGGKEDDQLFERVLVDAEVPLEHGMAGYGWGLNAVARPCLPDAHAEHDILDQHQHRYDSHEFHHTTSSVLRAAILPVLSPDRHP